MKKVFKWILIILGILIVGFIVLALITSPNTNTDTPEGLENLRIQQMTRLKNEWDKIETQIGNLNVTGYGDFKNNMEQEQSYCDYEAQTLTDSYGEDNELVNLLKQAWTLQGEVCGLCAQSVQGQIPAIAITAKGDELSGVLDQINNYKIQ